MSASSEDSNAWVGSVFAAAFVAGTMLVGLFLISLHASGSRLMTGLYKGSGLAVMAGAPVVVLLKGLDGGGWKALAWSVGMLLLSIALGFTLAMVDFFGIVGRGWQF